MNIKGKVALVTGGASGLGEATACLYHQLGAEVAIFDLNAEKGQALVEKLGKGALYQQVNVADEASVKAGIEAVVAAFKAIHICNNYAGIVVGIKTLGKQGAFPLGEFKRVIDTNLVGTFNVLRLVAEQMAGQDPLDSDNSRGVIINTSSVAAYEGQIGQAAYSASKGGIVSMTLPIARDLASLGIRVNTIVPGLVHTPMFESFPEKVYRSLEASVLYPQRLARPEEIARLSQYIVESNYTNGECIRIDGGIRMQPR